MNILIINAGSSSLKSQLLVNGKKHRVLAKFHADGIGKDTCRCTFSCEEKNFGQNIKLKNHEEAIRLLFEKLKSYKVIEKYSDIEAVGHRVVHGGEKYKQPVKIDSKVLKEIKNLCKLAPLHNPPNLEGIRITKKILKKTPQIAIFDTGYHHSLPEKAYLYGLPYSFYKKNHIRRYGFHGTSHQYVSSTAQKLLRKKNTKIISCHLGNGSSITANLNGKSVDTSMGFTPLEGVMMGTRSGSIDPAIIPHLQKTLKLSADKIEKILNEESGLKGFSEISSDMRKIYEKAQKNDARAKLTIEILAYQIAKYCGAYTAAMNGVDAIVFTAGLGQKAWYIRKQVCDYLQFLGIKLDSKKNLKNMETISAAKSKVKVFVIPTDEEKQMAQEIIKILK